jgi:hypothetical protein
MQQAKFSAPYRQWFGVGEKKIDVEVEARAAKIPQRFCST